MRRATIRQDRTTRTWTARRPSYGFSPHDEERTGFRTQRAALGWVNSTLRPLGSPAIHAELNWLGEDSDPGLIKY